MGCVNKKNLHDCGLAANVKQYISYVYYLICFIEKTYKNFTPTKFYCSKWKLIKVKNACRKNN